MDFKHRNGDTEGVTFEFSSVKTLVDPLFYRGECHCPTLKEFIRGMCNLKPYHVIMDMEREVPKQE